MDRLKAMQTFVQIADQGSLTKAADALDSSLPADQIGREVNVPHQLKHMRQNYRSDAPRRSGGRHAFVWASHLTCAVRIIDRRRLYD